MKNLGMAQESGLTTQCFMVTYYGEDDSMSRLKFSRAQMWKSNNGWR